MKHRVLLVDNGSTDGTIEAVARAHPDAAILSLPENLGFAAGMNAGLRRALSDGADWTLLVNNDATAGAHLLSDLLAASGHDGVGMLAPTIYLADRPTVVWPSAGRRRALTLAPIDTTVDPPTREPYDVAWATGCCLLVRSALWHDVGLFDERYRFYYEDHDLCLRARRAGWRIVHVPRATALHRVAGSTGKGSRAQMYLLARASVPFYLTHTRGVHRLAIVPYRLASAARTVLEALARGRPVAAAAYVRGLADGVRDVSRRGRAEARGGAISEHEAGPGRAGHRNPER